MLEMKPVTNIGMDETGHIPNEILGMWVRIPAVRFFHAHYI